jgi:hypothetical protein
MICRLFTKGVYAIIRTQMLLFPTDAQCGIDPADRRWSHHGRHRRSVHWHKTTSDERLSFHIVGWIGYMISLVQALFTVAGITAGLYIVQTIVKTNLFLVAGLSTATPV